MNNKKIGRTFWDLLSENPNIFIIIIILVVVIIIVLLFRGYSIKTPPISIEKTPPIINNTSTNKISKKEINELNSIPGPIQNTNSKTSNNQINVNNSPGSIITKDQTGDNIIINPQKPKVVHFENKTRVSINDNIYEKKFYFGNPEGLALRNVYLKVNFNSEYVFAIADKWVGTGMIVRGGEKIRRDTINNSLEFYAPRMGANIYIEVIVKSKHDIQIKDFQFSTD